jgi:hypothetical protein
VRKDHTLRLLQLLLPCRVARLVDTWLHDQLLLDMRWRLLGHRRLHSHTWVLMY